MKENTPKIGAGHVKAMFRQGLKETRGAFYPESNVAQPTEYGIYGTQTQGEIASDRRGDDRDYHEEGPYGRGSVLESRLQQSAERQQAKEPSREPERER